MLEKFCDLWEEPADAICITTNGFVKTNGKLVMGAGVAGQAQSRYPKLPAFWGAKVKAWGQRCYLFAAPDGKILVAFPVKDVWYNDARLDIIEQSAKALMEKVEDYEWKAVLLPRPGCGNGHLKWEDVKPVIEPILDDRVTVVTDKFEG